MVGFRTGFVCTTLFQLLAIAVANVDTGNMRDLGYPEPNWHPIAQGSAQDPAITVDPSRQVWGDIKPYSTLNEPLCRWSASAQNGGRGSCKTDLSWIHASVGLDKSLFSDPVINYILRFHIEGACYRSTQYSDNNQAQYCAPWWYDQATSKKINTTHICYEITQAVTDPATGAQVLRKWGCAHKAPVAGYVLTNATMSAPPVSAPTAAITNTTAPPGAVTYEEPASTGVTQISSKTGGTAGAGPANASDPVGTTLQPSPAASTPGSTMVGFRRLAQANATATPKPPGPKGPKAKNATATPGSPPTVDAPGNKTMAASSNSTTNVTGPVFATRQDFLTTGIYSNQGLELFSFRENWYACHESTLPATISRDTCYQEAFGKSFGLNAIVLRSMMAVMQVRIFWPVIRRILSYTN